MTNNVVLRTKQKEIILLQLTLLLERKENKYFCFNKEINDEANN